MPLFSCPNHAGNRIVRGSLRHILLLTAAYIAVIFGLFCILLGTVSVSMKASTEDNIHALTTLPTDESYDCILVLGAGLRADGSPSPMLHDRVTTACELHEILDGPPILMSGDHTGDYNEVGAMKTLAESLGVDGRDIFLDHEGYSTYESIYRAKETFGVDRVLIITQEYHLYRALHIAQALGMEADGVAADKREYTRTVLREGREILARFKDMFLAARRTPIGRLENPIDLNGDGNAT